MATSPPPGTMSPGSELNGERGPRSGATDTGLRVEATQESPNQKALGHHPQHKWTEFRNRLKKRRGDAGGWVALWYSGLSFHLQS